ncbi:MAG: class I SAM-dependent methyltransferase [Candidatus Omnitrophica bacterium]|nr:class I SAM-dependent methyltransferase [Candidatus Omnitrophota bacterium]
MSKEKTLQNCRLCNSPNIQFVLKKDDMHIFKCSRCGVVFLGNDLDTESVRNLYRYYSSDGFSNYLSPVTRLRYENLLDNFERYRKNNTIIDVGCGAGYFMLQATNRGWRVEGVEISDEAIKLAEEKGQHVIKGDIVDLDIGKGEYDVAVLTELLEHAFDPEGIIRRLTYAVRNGGTIYITTPNYNSLARRLLKDRWDWFHKEHLFYFTPEILTVLLKKYKFKIIKIRTKNISLGSFLKVFKGANSQDAYKVFERQEHIRHLTEENKLLFVIKQSINFILNIFKLGDTIYISAEK